MNARTATHVTEIDRAERQRQRILDAARHCFIKHGFDAASMPQIAARAGVSVGLPYRYFESKRAIMLALIRQQMDYARAGLARLSIHDNLGDALRAHFERSRNRKDHTLHIGLQSEIVALGMRDKQVSRDLQRNGREVRVLLAQWLQQRDAHHRIERSDAERETAAALLQSVSDGLSLLAAREPDFDAGTVDALLERVVPLVTGD